MNTQTAFRWPSRGQYAPTKEFRRDLGVRLKALMKTRDVGVHEVAEAIRTGPGASQQARARYRLRAILDGKFVPKPPAARKLARYFDLSLEQLAGVASNGAGGEARGVNVADRPRKDPPAPTPTPTPVALPKRAPPVRIELKTLRGHPAFLTVQVTGTVHVDRAMSLLALLQS